MARHPALYAWLVLAAAAATPAVGAGQPLAVGQVDTFTSGTTLNWSQGFPSDGPAVVGGGPGGAGDNALLIASGGTNPPRLTVFNTAQWSGNYPAAGVNAIEVDLRAPGGASQPLSVRLAFRNAGGGGVGYSSRAVALTDAGWHHAVFPLSAAEFTAVNGPATPFDTYVTSVAELRILHAVGPSVTGDVFTGSLMIDNVRASFVPIPEPAGLLLVVAACGRRAWRRRRDAGPV